MNSRNLVRVAAGCLLALGVWEVACAAGPGAEKFITQSHEDPPPLGIIVPDAPVVANLVTTEDAQTPGQRAALALALKAPQYIVLRSDDVALWNGSLLRIGEGFGEFPAIDEPLSGRGYINIGENAALINASGEMISLEPGALLFIEQKIDDQIAPIDEVTSGQKKCDTECDAGFYACCNFGTGVNPPTCKCISVTIAATCGSGGPGARSCALVQ